MKLISLASLAGVAIAATAFAANSTPADETTGSIVGRVVWDGEKPKPLAPLAVGADAAKGCHADESHSVDTTDRSLVISEKGGIANVVVTIKVKGAEAKPLEKATVIDQRGCRFEPHVAVVPVGSTVEFLNSDGVNHNVHTYPKKNKDMNKTVPGGSKEQMVATKAESFKVACDIHPWMSSHVFVTDSPYYALSDADGNFEIKGLPAGEYAISYWHEKLGKGKTEKVTVAAGGKATSEIKLNDKGDKKKKGGRRRR